MSHISNLVKTPGVNRTILVTGVSKGLGRAMVEGFIEAGHQIVGCARSSDEIAYLTSIYPETHQFDVLDISDNKQVEAWAEKILTRKLPDLIINNAGVINYPKPLWEISADKFDYIIDVNIKGTVNIIRSFLPEMVRIQKGIIVNFSSGWGRSTSPEVAPYCASKWAIEGLTKSLAQELPSGMGAIALNPGIIYTDMLSTCFGESASSYMPIPQWKSRAVPFLLGLSPRDNGKSLTVPVV